MALHWHRGFLRSVDRSSLHLRKIPAEDQVTDVAVDADLLYSLSGVSVAVEGGLAWMAK